MDEQSQQYITEIKAIFANHAMVSAMQQRMPNSGDEIDPAVRDKRWQEVVDTFCTEDANWWEPRQPNGK